MNICIITPTAGLERYARLSQTHLVLAHVRDRDYMNFYRALRDEGETIILDNGAHEKGSSVGWVDLEYCIAYYNPQICVLPDTINKEKETVSSSLRFLDRNIERFPKTEWMLVPQGAHWKKCVSNVVTDTRVGMYVSWIGVSRYLTIDQGVERTFVAEEIKFMFPKLKLHALGMVKGDVQELRSLRKLGLYESLDTSSPVWRGWNGKNLSDPWPEIPVDFSFEPTEGTDETIKQNLEEIGVTAK